MYARNVMHEIAWIYGSSSVDVFTGKGGYWVELGPRLLNSCYCDTGIFVAEGESLRKLYCSQQYVVILGSRKSFYRIYIRIGVPAYSKKLHGETFFFNFTFL